MKVLLQVYFMVSTPLQLCKQHTIHSYFYVLTFTYAWIIFCLYYTVLVIDPTVATENKELKNMPLWFNHTCHTIPPIVTVLEAFICQPKLISLRRSLCVSYALMVTYNIYMEVSIAAFQFSPYPKLDKIDIGYRYVVYIFTWLLVTVFTFIGHGLVRLVNQVEITAYIE
ncbi:hypothetical protein MN116_008238 [Schistosoma mekongi]|uniref:Uncharacterized protein n=1 Tax=Schistosoma mekongi TaxID=38744 RepID=A0AAE1Z752_SCHME|nr:hypothetical protein MN116_008238 [Schistosoma mekongi]